MFKGLPWLLPGTDLNLTNAHQQSATMRSVSVHNRNCNGRKVTEPQVSLCIHQYCAVIRGSQTQVGQNETPAHPHEQLLWWQPFPARVTVCDRLQSLRPE